VIYLGKFFWMLHLHDPKSAYSLLLLLNKPGAMHLHDEASHNSSFLTIIAPEEHITNKHGAVHLPDEASHSLSFLTIVAPEAHITTQNKLCPCGR